MTVGEDRPEQGSSNGQERGLGSLLGKDTIPGSMDTTPLFRVLQGHLVACWHALPLSPGLSSSSGSPSPAGRLHLSLCP